MHSHLVFHCDVKAGNIFLDRQGQAYLGDYGSCVIGGGIPHECSLATHWPADLPHQVTAMTPAIDFLLLTVTLLDLLGVITLDASTGPLTCEEIKTRVFNLAPSACKAFLMALNNYTVE
jgi:serine/threonine protein kinase